MKSTIRITSLLIVFLITLPQISMAYREGGIYGVTIHLTNNKKLNGYIETDWLLYSCKESKNDFKDGDQHSTWESFLKRQRDDIRAGLRTIDTVTFIHKIIQIRFDRYIYGEFITISWFVAAKSSFKRVKFEDIKSIEGVCRKWDGIRTDFAVEPITDYMAEYISNHKMIASYTINFEEDVPPSSGEYEYAKNTAYLSYNPQYPRKRLIKERKIIDKMSDDVLDKNKLIRFTWYSD